VEDVPAGWCGQDRQLVESYVRHDPGC
jgi:hypothetical protein